ncbi:N-acetyltransferase [uncultured Roseobacter sp.]|uniref:GNAT family N-acetyltransferase n=1 Tax=uncultured Roseobacter sp. TaxID=114847 RepID=UPI002622A733|nr:GNAT family N-acetyltransferase [uncultured Roseobacter sp.]
MTTNYRYPLMQPEDNTPARIEGSSAITSPAKIQSAEACSMEALCAAMNRSFSDYAVPMHLTTEAFTFMMRQRGLDRAASRIALVDGEIAALWLVSVRGAAGYLISSGTDPTHRRRGLSRALAAECLSAFKRAGAANLQTEVLIDNKQAHDLYLSLGMTTARVLDCYALSRPEGPAGQHEVSEVSWHAVAQAVQPLQDFRPSWQNDAESLNAIADDVRCHAVFDGAGVAGYAAIVPSTGTLAQIAVRQDKRRMGIAGALLGSYRDVESLRVINADNASDGFRDFMASLGAERTLGQYELKMSL